MDFFFLADLGLDLNTFLNTAPQESLAIYQNWLYRLALVFHPWNNVFFPQEKQALEKWSHNGSYIHFLGLLQQSTKG